MSAAANNAYKPLNPFWSILGGAGNAATMGGGMMAGAKSDERLKTDIKKIGVSEKGINIYEFRYKKNPNHKFIGVIAQELLEDFPEAVIMEKDGYYSVNYDLIDVYFAQV